MIKNDYFNIRALTATDKNNGFGFYAPKHNHNCLSNMLTVSANGANTGYITYQGDDFVVAQDSYALELIDERGREKEIYLYIAAVISKFSRQIFDYQNKAGWERLKAYTVSLPTTNNQPDYEYMANYVRQVEANYVRQVEAYLTNLGYENIGDVELTDEDYKVLERWEESEFKEFRLEDILQWQSNVEFSPLKLSEYSVDGSQLYPFIGQSTTNNGIISYHSLKEELKNNVDSKPTILIHSNNQNIVYVDTPFYLKDGHGATSILQADYLNKEISWYLKTVISKVILTRFSYNGKATKIGLKNTEVLLPTTNNHPDYQLMRDYIKVIEKKVVKNLKLELDKKLEAYKDIID